MTGPCIISLSQLLNWDRKIINKKRYMNSLEVSLHNALKSVKKCYLEILEMFFVCKSSNILKFFQSKPYKSVSKTTLVTKNLL